METIIENIRLKRAIDLFEKINAKTEFHYKKWNKARKRENIDFHYDKYVFYRGFSRRASDLIFSIRKGEKFGDGREWFEMNADEYKQMILKRKEENRLKFESNYRVYLYFFSESLGADYGTFNCDSCGREFYHSPSTVYLGAKRKYSCCCGHCVNTLMIRNKQEEVYC